MYQVNNTSHSSKKVLDLFSGIGGFSIGLEWAGGYETIAFCDNEPATHYWLKTNFPGTPIYSDIKDVNGHELVKQHGRIFLFTGGPPCQDVSVAGKGTGVGTKETPTERSGLVFQYTRLVDEIRPDWVLIENSDQYRTRGYDEIASELERIGYSCWPVVVPARNAGASHLRKRVWVIATNKLADAMRSGIDVGKLLIEEFQRQCETVGRLQQSEVPGDGSGEWTVAYGSGYERQGFPQGFSDPPLATSEVVAISDLRIGDIVSGGYSCCSSKLYGTPFFMRRAVEDAESERLQESVRRTDQDESGAPMLSAGSGDVSGARDLEDYGTEEAHRRYEELAHGNLWRELKAMADDSGFGLQGLRPLWESIAGALGQEGLPGRCGDPRGVFSPVAYVGKYQHEWEPARLVAKSLLESPVGRGADEVSDWLSEYGHLFGINARTKNPLKKVMEAQLKALGNSVVPVIPMALGIVIRATDQRIDQIIRSQQ